MTQASRKLPVITIFKSYLRCGSVKLVSSGCRLTPQFLQLEWAIITMQPTALGLTKLSFLYFYRRIFVTGVKKQDSFDILTYVAVIIVAAWTIAFLFANLFMCKGSWAALWTNLETLTTQCIKTPKMLLGLAVSDFLTDLMVILLPVPKVSLLLPQAWTC